MALEALLADLRALLAPEQIISAPSELGVYTYDASFHSKLAPGQPELVVVPRSTEQVAAIVALAARHRVPVTARGSASGQAGGAIPLQGGLVLALNQFDRILELDRDNLQVIVEPGVIHARLNEFLAPHGLIFPPDPGSSRFCTVGGMVANNAHGMRAVKYGGTYRWVLGLQVVLANGAIIETGSVGSRAGQSVSGLDLTRLFAGSEGTLGIITRLRLKLMPRPPARALALALFESLEDAGRAVQATFRAGITPSAIEILEANAIRAVNRYRPALALPEVEAMLLFELDGNPPGVRHDAEQVAATVGSLATKVEWSDDPRRIAQLWEARSVVGAAMSVLKRGGMRAYAGEDICVPIARVPETLRRIHEIARELNLVIGTYGHIGGGNIHTGPVIDPEDEDEIARVQRFADAVHRLALEVGGTVTGEHGVGIARARYMPDEHGLALDAMWAIKQALDPHGILNPGKIFPAGWKPRLRLEVPLEVQTLAKMVG